MNEESVAKLMLTEAGRAVGHDASRAQLIRFGENAVYRLPGGVIARVSRPGQQLAARREIAVSRWLKTSGIAAVTALEGIIQPIEVSDRSVTFWEELPPHQPGTPTQVALALKALHALPVPEDVPLGRLDPFVRLEQRISTAAIPDNDRRWLAGQATRLHEQWIIQGSGLPTCAVHGDAWAGNVVATAVGQVVLLDLERFTIGPPEWDLVSTAIKHVTYGGISRQEYDDFSDAYGRDVIAGEYFELLRDIRELRMTCYLAQHAIESSQLRHEAEFRIRCLRGQSGARPWKWTPVT